MLWQEVYKLRSRKARLSPDHSSMLVTVRNLTKAYARLGRTNDAKAVSAQAAIREAAGLAAADSLPATTAPVRGAETPQTNLTARLRVLRQLSSADGTDLAGRLAELSD